MTRTEEFSIDEQAQIEVDVASGTIQLVEGPAGQVGVVIDAANTDAFELSQIGDHVLVRQESTWRSRNQRVRIVITAPAGFNLVAATGSANLEARGRAGVVAARTASGEVEIEQATQVEVKTASGRVRIGAVEGSILCNTASGNVELSSTDGQVEASTASGNVDVAHIGDRVKIATASGNVHVASCVGDDIVIKTMSGNIRLGMPSGIRVEPEISTMTGRVKLPEPAPGSADQERRTVRVRLTSMSGNIRIDRSM